MMKMQFPFTVNAYEGMLKIIRYVINDANIEKTPKELPLLIASGNADPVGEYGKAVERIYNKYKNIWMMLNLSYMMAAAMSFTVK